MEQVRRILAVKLSSLGDLFHALPAVHNLKVGLQAEVDWVTQPEYGGLVGCFSDVSRVIEFPRRTWASDWPRFLRDLRARRYDLVVDFQGLLKSAWVARLAGGTRVIGPSFCREGSRFLYHAVAGPRNKNRHAVEESLDVVRFLGLDVAAAEFPVRFPLRTFAEPSPRVALIPVSRRGNKNWPAEYFVETAVRLSRDSGASLYLFGGPGDGAACAAIENAVFSQTGRRPVNLAGRTTLVQMGSWFSGMDLAIANDSGPMHMAAALGVPVVAVFGPTDPVRTGPYGARHSVLTAEGLSCRPCFRRSCREAIPECLRRVPPDRVLEAAARALKEKRS